MMNALISDKKGGVAILLAIGFMAVAVPVIASALALSSTLAIDSGVKDRTLKSQYAVIGGVYYAVDRLVRDTPYARGLTVGVPDTQPMPGTLNGRTVTITTERVTTGPLPPGLPPPVADASERIQTTKTVVPSSASPTVPTEFTYTITMKNWDSTPQNISHILDFLPTELTYVPFSTTGVTTAEPNLGATLDWTVSVVLQPGESTVLTFRASGSLLVGNYCNEASVTPGNNTSSGQTAPIKVGSPPNNLCQRPAFTITKTVSPSFVDSDALTTFTYDIAVENRGPAAFEVSEIQDVLDASFTYLMDSTSGDFPLGNPAIKPQGLFWDFPKVGGVYPQVSPGTTKHLVFQATASLQPGAYWNQVWVTMDGAGVIHPAQTWATAPVRRLARYKITATDGQMTASANVLVSPDFYFVTEWGIKR